LWFAEGGDYQNWALTKNGEGLVVDQDGTTLKVNLDKKSWTFAADVPESRGNRIVGSGVNTSGKTVVQREDGRQFWMDPLGNWRKQARSTLRNPGLERFITTERPVVSGVVEVGEVLSVSIEGWEPVPDSFEYRWFADGKRIRGEEQPSLTLSQDVLGKRISVLVRATKAQTLTVNRASSKTIAVTLPKISATTRPILSGDVIEGETLSVSVEGWEPIPDSFEYRWFADGKRLVGENGESLEISESMVGKRISVRVKALKPGYQSKVRFSVKTEPVMPFD
jgi:hypothetical protein